jgi:hypothetical protein
MAQSIGISQLRRSMTKSDLGMAQQNKVTPTSLSSADSASSVLAVIHRALQHIALAHPHAPSPQPCGSLN